MEILTLILLYYLSQNPDFPESVKPIMAKLKNSEHMLGFLNELSHFTQTFSTFQNSVPKKDTDKSDKTERTEKAETEEKKQPQSPTSGIADAFIQEMLESYLKKH